MNQPGRSSFRLAAGNLGEDQWVSKLQALTESRLISQILTY